VNWRNDLIYYIDDIYREHDIYALYGVGINRRYRIRCRTIHGWHPEFMNFDPDNLIGAHEPLKSKNQLVIVHRKDQEIYLRQCGYPNSHAVGSPFIYLPKQKPQTRKGFLVMPMHGCGEKDFGTKKMNLKSYLIKLLDTGYKVKELNLIIHANDYSNQDYCAGISDLGIKITMGAKGGDSSTFERLAALFSCTQGVITNSLGSHLVYASYYGAKIIFKDILPDVTFEELEQMPDSLNRQPSALKKNIEIFNNSTLKTHFPILFRDSGNCEALKEWAAKELGEDQKKSPSELAKIFGWNWINDTKSAIRFFAGKIRRKMSNGK
jgi:hypothetical protein